MCHLERCSQSVKKKCLCQTQEGWGSGETEAHVCWVGDHLPVKGQEQIPWATRLLKAGILPPLQKLLGSTHCSRQGNPRELYISWQKPLTRKGVQAWRPPFGEAELLVEASRSSVSLLVTLVWNVPINKLWLLRQSGWRQCPRISLLSSQYLGCWISLSQLTVRQEQVSYT